MKPDHCRAASIAATLLLGAMAPVQAGEVLADEALGEITAGTAAVAYSEGRLVFDLGRTTGRGLRIDALGDIALGGSDPAGDPAAINTGVLHLEDNAQGNLRALVNTNAVNSPVQVLINLNINVNSRVDVLNQINSALQQR